jgi:ribulose-phosphate 3-epimerase
MLKCDFGALTAEIGRLERAGARILHWDVMDGHFVPNLTYGPLVIRAVRPRTGLFFDAHLMIAQPERYLDEYLQAGCDGVTIHVEAVSDPVPLLRRIRAAGAWAGLALNPRTPIERVRAALPECDLVLAMSVEPGFGGQKFLSEVLPKVRELRQIMPCEAILSIDGGIGPETIEAAAAAGAQWFVAGSAIFDRADYAAALRELEQRLPANDGGSPPG